MARSDLIISLVKAGSSGNRGLLERTTEALIAEERSKRHDVLADRIEQAMRADGNGSHRPAGPSGGVGDLFYELTPVRSIEDLLLHDDVAKVCREVVEEHYRRDLLRSHNLEPRHRILLTGPPGNGKTSLAEAIAGALMVPLIVIRYEGVVGSYLGETASRLRRLFDYVRTRSCVLFFDEFDTLGKERGDVHETGEIKRVVSTLLLQIDALPPHVCVITATNHPELLDRAVWRRFQVRVDLAAPTKAIATRFLENLAARLDITLGYAPRTIAEKLRGASFAELEQFVLDVVRRRVLALPDADMKTIVGSRLTQWQRQLNR